MRKLWITLPALAPDYSGVCSAMFELGGLSVIHDASGCTGNYTGYDEPRWYGSKSAVFCSGLREIDAVLGRDDKLIDQIVKACADLQPSMVTVLGSPVPMLIGTDMDGIACEVEERTGLPAFGFSTSGLALYNQGVSQAICALIRRFCRRPEEKIPRGVNLLGMTPLDFSTNSNAQDIVRLLEDHGFPVIGRLMMGVTLEQIQRLGEAQVNLVVSEAGFAPAQLLWQRYGIPYVVGLPVGEGETVCRMLEETLADGQCRIQKDPAEQGDLLIVGEQVAANALRHAIRLQDPQAKVVVGTMFGLRAELASEGDLDIPDEEALRKQIHSHRFRRMIGDPLFEDLIGPADNLRFYPLPHVAVSSKVHWDVVPAWLGTPMQEMIQTIVREQKECE